MLLQKVMEFQYQFSTKWFSIYDCFHTFYLYNEHTIIQEEQKFFQYQICENFFQRFRIQML